jgi:lipopolysaccharide transport system permease protein
MSNNNISVITPKKNLFDFKFAEIWRYRDLLVLFFKRDIIITYKQTVLGPLWFIIQPLLTTLMYVMVFSKIAGISTGGVPPVLFYLGGITIWNFFADCLRLNSSTFTNNAYIFGKVYFPRIITPLSVIVSNLIKFGIQLILFLLVYIYFIVNGSPIHPNATLFLLPIYLILLSLLALGFSLAISALTTKYRDFTFLVTFGVQLWMYATPVIYTIDKIPAKYQKIIMANPTSSIIEGFKYSFTGMGTFDSKGLIYSSVFSVVIFFFGLAIFNRTEKTFMDTV